MNDDSNPRVRVSRSPLLYLMTRDARGRRNCCSCSSCVEPRDRPYGHRHRYGERTIVSTRRVDRVDISRELY